MCIACEIIKDNDPTKQTITIDLDYFKLCRRHQPKTIAEVAPHEPYREWARGLPMGVHYYRLKEVSTARPRG